MKIAIDTNLLIYILQGHETFGEAAKLAASSYAKENVLASEAVFVEILASKVFTGNETAYKQAKSFLEQADITYIPTTRDVYLEAAKIRRSRPSIKLPDAIHLASAWMNDAEVFVTNDDSLVRVSTRVRKITKLPDFVQGL